MGTVFTIGTGSAANLWGSLRCLIGQRAYRPWSKLGYRTSRWSRLRPVPVQAVRPDTTEHSLKSRAQCRGWAGGRVQKNVNQLRPAPPEVALLIP
jgi:hypothetical protein